MRTDTRRTVKWMSRHCPGQIRRVRVAAVFIAIPCATACREPTQAYLELSTDALCSDVVDTSITIATSADLESELPDATTRHCSEIDGRIGSLGIVPSAGESDRFSVRVVTGLGKSADDCITDKYFGGCIVARRSVHYLPHQTIYLPIEMSVICRDVPCGATETCKNGHCVDATIADVASCTSAKGCDIAAGGARAAGGTGSSVVSTGGVSALASTGGVSGSSSSGVAGYAAATAGGTTGQGGATATNVSSGGGRDGIGGLAQGGSEALGGAAQGGTTELGGTHSVGGEPATGGSISTGGTAIGIGGASLGGTAQATGGTSVSLGGAPLGGAPTGGTSTGGTSTGGTSTGGTSTGGTSTGGTSTGGAATGGDSTGGIAATAGASNPGTGGVAGSTGLPAICGDGVLDPYAGEFCDTSGASAACNANCTPQRCGDGIVNAAAGEACDGSTASVHCTPSCRISSCGDGYVDTSTGEQCELGMTGCNACQQDVSGLTNALRVEAVRSELLLNTLGLDLTIKNNGPTVSTRGLALRFYYTPDSASTQTISCGFLDANCSNVSMSVKALPKTCANATHYAEISVNSSSNLTTGSSFHVQGSVTGGLLALYDFGNDYSRAEGILFAAETQTIALFQNGKLVWGKPPCGCGNGALDNGEACDHSGESAACDADCTWAFCGDGKVNAAAGESCDEGKPSLSCNPECHATGLPASAAPALLQWLDASKLSSLALVPRISIVADRSGNSNDVSQANTSKQPSLFPSAFGSLPAVFFDGANHELVAGSPVNDWGRGSVFVVHRVEPVGTTATLVANGWYGSGGGVAIRAQTQRDGLGISLGSTSGFATTQWTLGALVGSGPPTSRATYLAWDPPSFAWATGGDSASLTSSAAYTSTSSPLALGGISALEPYRGWIGELIVFNRILTTSERDAILNYLRQKWAVP